MKKSRGILEEFSALNLVEPRKEFLELYSVESLEKSRETPGEKLEKFSKKSEEIPQNLQKIA